MPTITFIEHSGEKHPVEIVEGKSLMEIAMDNGVPGIDADCGGDCACGTCHVIVSPQWLEKTGSVNAEEESMLSMTPEKADSSRLACQITTTNEMDGMEVTLPEFQM